MAVLPSSAATVITIGIILLMQGCGASVVSEALCSRTLDPTVTPCSRKVASDLVADSYGETSYNKLEQCSVNSTTTVYAQASCVGTTPTCGDCMSELTAQFFNSCPDSAVGGQVNSSGCSFRYEIYPL